MMRHIASKTIMRGMIGERLLMRFAGRVRHPLESAGLPETSATQAGGETNHQSADADAQKGDMMSVYKINIEQASIANSHFRQVLFTGPQSQLVLMALLPGEDMGPETRAVSDQFIHIERGRGRAVIDGQNYDLEEGCAIVIPAGTAYNVMNPYPEMMLRLYAIYTPPEYPAGTIHRTKAEAQAARQPEPASLTSSD
jgi:mannose-6-phosphate isomerase-like protein (cupin superfamily)